MARKKLFIFFFIQLFLLGLGGSIVGPLIPILADGFKVSLDTIGSTFSLNAFGLLLTSLLSGILSERFGKRNIFILGSILYTVSFLGLYLSDSFIYFTLSYIVFGMSWGMLAVNSVSIISDIFHLNRSKIIILNLNWKYLFLSLAIINILLFITVLSFRLEDLHNKKSEENFLSLFTTSRRFLSNSIIILCGIINFLHAGLGFSFGTWFTAYFKNLNVPVPTGSLILSLYLLSFTIGMYIKSTLVARFEDKKLMQYSSILAFVFLFISFFMDRVIFKIIFIMLFGLSFSGIAAASLSMSIKQSPRHSGSITSIINSFSFTGVIIFQYTAGYLSENVSISSVIYISLTAIFLLVVFTSILSSYYKSEKKPG